MILYTIMPSEWVFPPQEEFASEIENFNYHGVLVTAEKSPPYGYRIIKITSTNPNDYLSENLQPGSYILLNT